MESLEEDNHRTVEGSPNHDENHKCISSFPAQNHHHILSSLDQDEKQDDEFYYLAQEGEMPGRRQQPHIFSDTTRSGHVPRTCSSRICSIRVSVTVHARKPDQASQRRTDTYWLHNHHASSVSSSSACYPAAACWRRPSGYINGNRQMFLEDGRETLETKPSSTLLDWISNQPTTTTTTTTTTKSWHKERTVPKGPPVLKQSSYVNGKTKKRRRRSAYKTYVPLVSFSDLTIREYPLSLGDNPSCALGPPVSMSWDHIHEETMDMEEYESQRQKRRTRLWMSGRVRRALLLGQGYSPSQMQAAMKQVRKIRFQRTITGILMPVHRVEECRVDLVEGFKRLLFWNKNK
eukprot:CAMPEP_0116834148 /NCGR_PEP_ID=MMETSP0418-20121206/6831_1 /TAXON_ID=1158023 /ORGANISM="Astrosyne radiata, Strain 13vi08-1A" /LENGTH=346 /DNA_ID=CAMNT_0004463677 /DNA_START=27 /DNA_END=1067 /DNA_ORIENTATION=+